MSLAARVTERARGQVQRADPTSLEEFGALLGAGGGVVRTRAGVPIGAGRVLAIDAWYSGVRYLSEKVSGLPVHTFRKRAGLGVDRERRADPPWLTRPDVDMVWLGLVEGWMMSLLHRGNAYAFKLRDRLGRVIGLRWLHPDRVKVTQDDQALQGLAPGSPKRFIVDGRQDRPLTTRDVLHIPGLSYDGVIGIDPIRAQAQNLGTVAAADEFAGRQFGQGSAVQAYISVPKELSEPAANRLKAVWDAQHKGLVNAGEIAVMGGGAEYRTLSLDPQQMQLLESRKYGVVQVARILRIPPTKLYDMARATWANVEQLSIEASQDSIQPWTERIEAWINADPDLLPPRNYIEFSLEGLLRGATRDRYESYRIATGGAPWLAPNEVRALENRPPLPGLDEVRMPLNMGDPGGEPDAPRPDRDREREQPPPEQDDDEDQE